MKIDILDSDTIPTHGLNLLPEEIIQKINDLKKDQILKIEIEVEDDEEQKYYARIYHRYRNQYLVVKRGNIIYMQRVLE